MSDIVGDSTPGFGKHEGTDPNRESSLAGAQTAGVPSRRTGALAGLDSRFGSVPPASCPAFTVTVLDVALDGATR